jgi:hypothetical protein
MLLNLFCNTNPANSHVMKTLQHPTDRTELSSGAVTSYGDCNPVQIRVIDGQLWITQEGDGRDVIVQPGMSFLSARHGKLVVQALDRSIIEVRRLCEG